MVRSDRASAIGQPGCVAELRPEPRRRSRRCATTASFDLQPAGAQRRLPLAAGRHPQAIGAGARRRQPRRLAARSARCAARPARATTCCSTSSRRLMPGAPSETRLIARHAGTVLVGQLAVMAFGVTDTIVAGRYAEAALAALSVGSADLHQRVRRADGRAAGAAADLGRAARRRRARASVGRSVRQALYLCGARHRSPGMAALLFPGAAAALDRGARGDAQAEVERYLAVLALALPPALLFRAVQHAEPEPGQAAAGDLAADRRRWR